MDMANIGNFLLTSAAPMPNSFGRSLQQNGIEIQTQWSLEPGLPTVAVGPTQIDDNVNGKNDSELAPPLTKSKKPLKSDVWKNFDIVNEADGTKSAKCRHCSKKYEGYSSSKGTSNLLKHMQKCIASGEKGDGDAAKCRHCPKKYKGYSSKKGTSNMLKHRGKCIPSGKKGDADEPADDSTGGTKFKAINPVLNRGETVFDEECSAMSISRMIIKHAYPLCFLENNMPPTLKFQSQGSFKADILHIYTEEKEKLRTSLNKSSPGRFNLTINLWRRETMVLYCCLTLHFIDEDWELKKKVLGFKKVKPSHSFWEPVRTFRSMLPEWSINETNLCCITTQSTEEVNVVVGEIRSWLHGDHSLRHSSARTLFHIDCFVHILNLLVEDGLEEVRDVHNKIMRCIFDAHATQDNEFNFRQAVDIARSKGKKVISEDMPGSWTLSTQILEKVIGLRDVFDEFESIDMNYSLNPIKMEEWEKATNIYKCLEVLDDAARSFSASKCLTTNLYFPEVCKIYWHLCQWEQTSNSGVQSLTSKMKNRFDKYWDNSILGLAIAVILDPRFKFDIVELWLNKIFGDHGAQIQCEGIKIVVKEVYDEYAGASRIVSGDASTSYDSDHYDMVDALGLPYKFSCDAGDDDKSQKSELEQYLEEPKFRSIQEFDVLGWWRFNTPNFPIVAKIARDFLSIPISAAQSNPSLSADVLKIDGSIDLNPEIIEALICAKDWLFGNP